jgi:hypothetical protein
LDDLLFEAPTVFDNLIFKGEMPPTIAVGIPSASNRPNRSFEFDSLGDRFARFLVEELLPEIERHRTLDGRPIRLSKNPNDRAVGGLSSGGTAAFTLGWTHPEQFRRIFTAVGSFVAERDSYKYALWVRKYEPKPLRVFMQDGSNDDLTDIAGEIGDLWMGNQTLERALAFSGYEVAHVWGEGVHSAAHGTSIFPDAMRWLWKGWPKPISPGISQNTVLRRMLKSGEDWVEVKGNYLSAAAATANPHGDVVFQDEVGGATWLTTRDDRLRKDNSVPKAYVAMAFGPNGHNFIAGSTGIGEYEDGTLLFSLSKRVGLRD